MPCPTGLGFQLETREAAGNTADDEDGGLAMDWLRSATAPLSSPSHDWHGTNVESKAKTHDAYMIKRG